MGVKCVWLVFFDFRQLLKTACFDNPDIPYSGHAHVFLVSCPFIGSLTLFQHFNWMKDETNIRWNLSAYYLLV